MACFFLTASSAASPIVITELNICLDASSHKNMALNTIRCLVLSDTHDDAFPEITSKADVALHCGDLTMIGGLSNYRKALANMQTIDAELKLVIAGNHDVSLDAKWWADNLDEEDDDPEEPAKARKLFEEAKADNGIHLLDEGLHHFMLQDGRRFSVFASPYTPEFGGYAFSYAAEEDHFNTGNAIPNDVDIVMTHGPPLPPSPFNYFLDLGHRGEHCGCPKLFRAIKRSRPQLHCFGHIHEGHGAEMITWEEDQRDEIFEVLATENQRHAVPLATEEGKTLLVNAAIMTHRDAPDNKPWIVDIKAASN